MSEHKHTDECLEYAAVTGVANCIADCADAREARIEIWHVVGAFFWGMANGVFLMVWFL